MTVTRLKAMVQRRDDVAELVLSSPPLNLFDEQMILDFETALAEVQALAGGGEIRALLLRAEGEAFCGGVDVNELSGRTPAQALK